MAGILFTNFARSQLAAPLLAGDLSLTVQTGHGARFPNPGVGDYFYLVLENAALDREIVKCTGRAVDTLTIVRAQDNTTALGWNAGDIVALRFVAAAIADAVTGTAMLTGAAFTGAVSMAALLTANGGAEVPVDATGNNARRANQLIWNVGGAARLPQWATAGRPAAPTQGDTGENTDLDCIEHYNGTEWVQLQRQSSAVVATTSGTSHAITGIPAYATRVELHLDAVSTTGTQPMLVQAGTSAGVVVTGYAESASYDIFAGTFSGAITAGFPVPLNAATATMRGTVTLFRKPGTNRWECQGLTSRTAGGLCWTTGYIDLPGALDRIALSRSGADSFDAGAAWATWS